ncbi:heme-binding protein [Steroidobacter sp. S1-65]|uniref:Heme-binding protein n=1 Tax=Steroidobacter gossypii TaxID=2805490 RepID=A0ABS1WWH8_9GAMM|nr:heme-binding protein [Steroidobacter gossypii]MBM0105330.1 heme-binding protein [Steroidobacter gossypii]
MKDVSTPSRARRLLLLPFMAALLVACSGGSSVTPDTGTDVSNPGCNGSCLNTGFNLTVADVQQVIAQGVAEAQARGVNATIAVVDRVGNVLAVYRMGDASTRSVTVTTSPAGDAPISGGLEGIRLPTQALQLFIDHAAAIAKAVTGAYLSSEGNAFSTRVASQIVQENFNPGEQLQPAGPLFGVQFSSLACSDLVRQFNGTAPSIGPQRTPLGLSADPGGFPLYKGGTVVGGVGVLADGFYTIDKSILDRDVDIDEAIALAATFGFSAPVDRRADRITVDGKILRFTDVEFAELSTNPQLAPGFASLAPTVGQVIPVLGYTDGVIRDGTVFGQPGSGIRPDADQNFPGRDAFVLVDETNTLRFPPRTGTDAAVVGGAVLSESEVRTLLQSALDVANRARAQIRRPTGSQARVTISVVDTQGAILGIARTRDAPLFGTDVSLQKARTAAFMSSNTAAAFVATLPDAKYLATTDAGASVVRAIPLNSYVAQFQAFMNNPNALADGSIAYTDRAFGNLARPFFPDGINYENQGPLSKPRGEWSPFSTGMQLDLSINAILQHVLFVSGLPVPDVAPGCAGVQLANDLSSVGQTIAGVRLGNGLQIFPGSVPIYRGNTLIGGIGVSGDGVDQDDMIAFLGLQNAGQALNGAINNAPPEMRADTLTPMGVRLRYVQCPQAPFIDVTDDNVCGGM